LLILPEKAKNKENLDPVSQDAVKDGIAEVVSRNSHYTHANLPFYVNQVNRLSS